MDTLNELDSLIAEHRRSDPGTNRQAWLSAWEREAFKVTDDMQQADTKPSSTSFAIEPVAMSSVAAEITVASSELPALGLLRQQALPITPVIQQEVQHQYSVSQGLRDTGSNPAAQLDTKVSQRAVKLDSATRPSPLELPPALGQQLREYSAHLLKGEKGYVLWLRDYGNRHSNALRDITQAVSEFLAVQGESLSQIKLNGSDITIAQIKTVEGSSNDGS